MVSKQLTSRQRALDPKPLFDDAILSHALERLQVPVEVNKRKLWRNLIQRQLPTWDQKPRRKRMEDAAQEATPSHSSDEESRRLGPSATVDEMTAFKPDYTNLGLPKTMVKMLDSDFAVCTSRVIKRTDAKDGSTTKLLIELQDGKQVEAVIMRYGQVELESFPEEEQKRVLDPETGAPITNFKSNKRATLCVSSQVGCAMGCTFCATGTMGLMANLTAGEIVEQLYHASKIERIRNVVFMGMGEPLDNYAAVISAIEAMTDTARFAISSSRISISTVGIVPRIRSMIEDVPDVGLALSLHAPTQEKRMEIVPTSKSYHIDDILDACDQFIDNQNNRIKKGSRKRHILTEYVLIGDVNSTPEVAHQLGKLLAGRSVLLNAIPYNPTPIEYDYRTPTREESREFVDIVRSYGVKCLLRQTMGADVGSACGQLVIENQSKSKGNGNCGSKVTDMEDLGSKDVAVPKKGRVIKRRKQPNASGEPVEADCSPALGFTEKISAAASNLTMSDYAVGISLVALICVFTVRALRS